MMKSGKTREIPNVLMARRLKHPWVDLPDNPGAPDDIPYPASAD